MAQTSNAVAMTIPTICHVRLCHHLSSNSFEGGRFINQIVEKTGMEMARHVSTIAPIKCAVNALVPFADIAP